MLWQGHSVNACIQYSSNSSDDNSPFSRAVWANSSNRSKEHCLTTELTTSSILLINNAKRSLGVLARSSKSLKTIISPKIDAVSASVNGGWYWRYPFLYAKISWTPWPLSCAKVALSTNKESSPVKSSVRNALGVHLHKLSKQATFWSVKYYCPLSIFFCQTVTDYYRRD